MQNANVLIGIITLSEAGETYRVIGARWGVGSSTIQSVRNKYKELGKSLEELTLMPSDEVVELFYPKKTLLFKPEYYPDYDDYLVRMIRGNGKRRQITYYFKEYRKKNPEGYQRTQFFELFRRVLKARGIDIECRMLVDRKPGEKLFIDWVGDKSEEILFDKEKNSYVKLHIFATTLAFSSLFYAEAFLDEQIPAFLAGVSHAIRFYGGVPRYLVPDNVSTAVTRHTKDELVLTVAFSDLEDHYDAITLPPPAYKPKGKPSVEGHVQICEEEIIPRLEEKTFTSLEAVNREIWSLLDEINKRPLTSSKDCSRQDLYEKYDKACLKPLPMEDFRIWDYKMIRNVPSTYHINVDHHFYSVPYTYTGKTVIAKISTDRIVVCDERNQKICEHLRSYETDRTKLKITIPAHQPENHRFWTDLESWTMDDYLQFANSIGPSTSEMFQRIMNGFKHVEQSFHSCCSLRKKCEKLDPVLVEETAKQSIAAYHFKYSEFTAALTEAAATAPKDSRESLAQTGSANLRGRDAFK